LFEVGLFYVLIFLSIVLLFDDDDDDDTGTPDALPDTVQLYSPLYTTHDRDSDSDAILNLMGYSK